MGKKRTNKSTFKSIYSDSFVTPAQYLTEALCFLVARQSGKDLADKFWEEDESERGPMCVDRESQPYKYKPLTQQDLDHIRDTVNAKKEPDDCFACSCLFDRTNRSPPEAPVAVL